MDFAWPAAPSRDSGAVSPRSPVESALQNIRRSLSRSPSKMGFAHCARSPRSLSPSGSPHSSSMTPTGTPPAHFDAEYYAHSRRPALRRSSPLSTSAQQSPARSSRRALGMTTGNLSTPSASQSSSGSGSNGQENSPSPLSYTPKGEPNLQSTPIPFRLEVPKTLSPRPRRPREWRPSKSSPLKRSDAGIGFSGDTSPAAKRRTICAGVISPGFDSLDFDQDGNDSDYSDDPELGGSSLPPVLNRRPRRSDASARPIRRSFESPRDRRSPRKSPRSVALARPRFRIHGDQPYSHVDRVRLFRESMAPYHRDEPHRPQFVRLPKASPHPLSQALSPTSPTPSGKDAFAMHHNLAHLDNAPGPRLDFSRSLPPGALRPELRNFAEPAAPSSSFETPKLYRMARPDPAAFRSTGLISKKHRNPDDLPPPPNQPGMPDTPCKKGAFDFGLGAMSPAPDSAVKPAAGLAGTGSMGIGQPQFGAPSKPFNLYRPKSSQGRPDSPTSASGGPVFGSHPLQRTISGGLLLDEDMMVLLNSPTRVGSGPGFGPGSASGDSHSQSSGTDEFPPTPTKLGPAPQKPNSLRSTLLGRRPPLDTSMFAVPAAEVGHSEPIPFSASRVSSGGTSSPHTPADAALPDPSGLSISPALQRRTTPTSSQPFGLASLSSLPPATPTHREGFFPFESFPLLVTPSNHAQRHDLDPTLSRRFKHVEWYGRGEFSEVYKVFESAGYAHQQADSPARAGLSSSSLATARPDSVYIVKRSRDPLSGAKLRRRKLREVEIMRALGKSRHTVELVNSWESAGHLYIQTEFCEEGSLETFLATAGNRGRLDDFRIWKILIELGEGLRHIHDSGFMHLDLKPANVFIDFSGSLKIGDFGLASEWPAPAHVEGEGDRRYIGPDLLQGLFDKPADVFALGMIMFEIAGNCIPPDNGHSWHQLRSGDWGDLPSLMAGAANSMFRDLDDDHLPAPDNDDDSLLAEPRSDVSLDSSRKSSIVHFDSAMDELAQPPGFMLDPQDPDSLEAVIHWMMQPDPHCRPVVDDIRRLGGCAWVGARRRAGAVIFEGNWGPPAGHGAGAGAGVGGSSFLEPASSSSNTFFDAFAMPLDYTHDDDDHVMMDAI